MDFVTNSLYVATVALRLVAWHKVSKCQKSLTFVFLNWKNVDFPRAALHTGMKTLN